MMTSRENYIASAGQTYIPFCENIHVKFPSFEPPAKPEPLLPELTLTAEAIEKGYVLPSQKQHFLPGVTEEIHVICEGVFNDAGELVDSTIHEWENAPGGLVHITMRK